MQQITLDKFIGKYQAGFVTEVVVIKDKIYGRDTSYSFDRAKAGLESEIVWAVIP